VTVVALSDYRARIAPAPRDLPDDEAIVASYVADYRVSLAVSSASLPVVRAPEAAALWLLADALEELSDAAPEDLRGVASALHAELRRRGVAL
jgi:hypothetical protein